MRLSHESIEKSRHEQPPDYIEPLMIVPDKNEEYKSLISKAVFAQTCEINEDSIEALIKLLYTNSKVKIPINSLFFNICASKRNLFKLLNTLLIILSKHQQYEKLFEKKSQSIVLSDYLFEKKVMDCFFPPVIIYRRMEINHLVYKVISLRIISLLTSLIKKPKAIIYFFKPISEVSSEDLMLKSMCNLQKELGEQRELTKTPLTELFMLIQNDTYRGSEKHLEAMVNFLNDLLNASEQISQNENEEKKLLFNVSLENVKQACKIFCLEKMNDITFHKLAQILLSLSQTDDNMNAIKEELENLVDMISSAVIKEWNKDIAQLCLDTSSTTSEISKGINELQKETHVEIKLGRILQVIKFIYDGYKLSNYEDTPVKSIRLYNSEGDTIEDPLLPAKCKSSQNESDSKACKIHVCLMNILKKEQLIEAFSVLTDLLSLISKRSTAKNSSRKSQLLIKLMPAIEGIIMTYDYYLRDQADTIILLRQMKEIKESKPEAKEGMRIKYKRAYVFYTFLEKNHKAFNNLIRQMSHQSFQSMIKPFILRFPNLLDFENKRNYFSYEQKRIRGYSSMSSLHVNIGRKTIFNDSYSQLANISLNTLKGRLKVTFKGEEAADVGGVTREWYTTLSRAMFNPDIALFKKSAHGHTYQPDPNSVIEKNHLDYFKFIGRIIGKALLDSQYLECYFTRALYKSLVGKQLTIQDLQDYDQELYNSLLWMRDNDVTDLDCNFTYTADYFGKLEIKELMPNGVNVKLTNENKETFIVKMCKALLHDAIQEQIEALQRGLYELIPKSIISIFDSKEIELLISGHMERMRIKLTCNCMAK